MIVPLLLSLVVAADDAIPAVPDAAPVTEAVVAPPVPEPAATADEIHDGALSLRFADHLFGDGDYYRAISEYRRFLFLTKGRGPESPRAALAIGEALLRGEQFDAAGRQLDGVATRTLDMELRRTALFGAARAYLEDGRPELAKPRFRLIVEDPESDAALSGQSRWLLAWGHFDAGELEKARDIFMGIAASNSPWAKEAQGVVDAIEKKGELDTKDPLIAALLSIVPGGGHFYLGQWGTGFTSLTWNALFIFAAVSAWLSGDWGIAVVLTFAELGWYSGSMFGAIAGAFRHNRDVVKNWRDETLTTYGASRALPELHELEGQPPGSLLRFRGTF
ncbi:MAG: tetratricopeptide repeat protein [Deltaproteobacteria bacterium]|nr:tetratricopeptide repeat protein [Deltaproteobacteria bacterium]